MKQQPQRIEFIPISEIRVVNPRARNKVTFQNIVANIGNVGLKKPITVCQRELGRRWNEVRSCVRPRAA